MAFQPALLQHLKTGATTVARAWGLTRKDGVRLGFTDHDQDLSFEGFTFRAASGLSASAVEQSTGLSVDNAEAVGILSDASVSEADIRAGRLDGAEVVSWAVNWSDVTQRSVLFRGSIGEIRQSGPAFTAELRGLAERLNMPRGRVYQKPCTAVLGDDACRFDLAQLGYVEERAVEFVHSQNEFSWSLLEGFAPGWFTRGQLQVLSGAAQGLVGLIKSDTRDAQGQRVLTLWEQLRDTVVPGDEIRLVAGCDKRFSTCQSKFVNTLNFQGFPDIPGEDWITSYPVRSGVNSGESLR